MRILLCLFALAALAAVDADKDELIDDYSVVVPLTLEQRALRMIVTPPDGVAPKSILCDIGVTGTVLSNARGTSGWSAGETVVKNMANNDKVDVVFSDRYKDRHGDLNRVNYEHKMDFYVGLKIEFSVNPKVAQLEIRGVYSLPSGDLESLTYQSALRKRRILSRQIHQATAAKKSIPGLTSEIQYWRTVGNLGDQGDWFVARRNIARLQDRLAKAQAHAAKIPAIERDIAAFNSVDEYLKVKVHGAEVYVRFHADDQTIPINADELKKRKIIPIRVRE